MNYLINFRKRNYIFSKDYEAIKFANDIFNKCGIVVEISLTKKPANRIYKEN